MLAFRTNGGWENQKFRGTFSYQVTNFLQLGVQVQKISDFMIRNFEIQGAPCHRVTTNIQGIGPLSDKLIVEYCNGGLVFVFETGVHPLK